MGKATRDDTLKKTIRDNYPGPGNYDQNAQGMNNPSFKFGSENRGKKIVNNTPGPGHYHIPYSMMDVPRYLTSGGGFSDQARYI
jgi:hypothetical protein